MHLLDQLLEKIDEWRENTAVWLEDLADSISSEKSIDRRMDRESEDSRKSMGLAFRKNRLQALDVQLSDDFNSILPTLVENHALESLGGSTATQRVEQLQQAINQVLKTRAILKAAVGVIENLQNDQKPARKHKDNDVYLGSLLLETKESLGHLFNIGAHNESVGAIGLCIDELINLVYENQYEQIPVSGITRVPEKELLTDLRLAKDC